MFTLGPPHDMKHRFLVSSLILVFSSAFSTSTLGQIISIQTRYVPSENIPEFIENETTYWSEVARKAILERKMVKWELWEVVTGMNIDEGANFLFINEYRNLEDVDSTSEIWDHTAVFPDMDRLDVETQNLSTLVDQVFLFAQVSLIKSRPNFMRVNFARSSNLGRYLELENTIWRDFVEERMDAGQTNVVSWDLMRVMSPSGVNRSYDAITIDGFETLSDALQTDWGDNPDYPDLDQFREVHEKSYVRIYRLTKRVAY